MLLTKKLKIRIVGNVAQYYKKNNIDIVLNEVNIIPIELVNPKSHLLVDAKCDVCNKEVKIQYRRYNQSVNKGGYYTCSSKCSKNKKEKTFELKYGDKSVFKTDNFKEKTKKTFLKKWGSEHFRQSNKWKVENLNSENQKRVETIFKLFLKNNPDVVDQDEENFVVNCKIHGPTKIKKSVFSNRKIIKTELCSKCKPVEKNISGKEVLLNKIIGEIYDGEIINSFKIERKEIDIYLPEFKLGFEFNGIRWHSELYVNKNYHLEKTKLCEKYGIKLIHIYEDDFDFKLDIIKSIISNVIKKSKKIFARKTTIRKIDEKHVIKDFLNKNHLQGFVNTNINYGLFYEGELVSLMTFMKTRKVLDKNQKEGEYELVRFCNKLGISVVGGASKLFKCFLNNHQPKKILSYCDISWATGELYKKLGFETYGFTPPNYSYVINKVRKNRINYQKHKLVKMGYDSKLTEREIMNTLGYYRIFNCGNERFVYSV